MNGNATMNRVTAQLAYRKLLAKVATMEQLILQLAANPSATADQIEQARAPYQRIKEQMHELQTRLISAGVLNGRT